MNEKIDLLQQEDVIKVKEKLMISHTTFTVNEFTTAISDRINDKNFKQLIENGVEADVLIPGKPWREGRIRLSMEFIIDEPESPLDEFRNQ